MFDYRYLRISNLSNGVTADLPDLFGLPCASFGKAKGNRNRRLAHRNSMRRDFSLNA